MMDDAMMKEDEGGGGKEGRGTYRVLRIGDRALPL
jgi:hypothetical protein